MAAVLCLRFGFPFVHPDILLRLMTVREILDWIQINDEMPFDEHRKDERAKLLFANQNMEASDLNRMLANFNRDENPQENTDEEMLYQRKVTIAKNEENRRKLAEKKRLQLEASELERANTEQQAINIRPT